MPRYFITRLTVEGFRGVNNESDPLDIRFRPETVNSVFAVNGIGKSSIFEAIYYSIFGTIPKLDLLQAQERPQDYFCNRFHTQQSATIALDFKPNDEGVPVTIRLQTNTHDNRPVTSPSCHPDPKSFLPTLPEDFTPMQ